MLSSKSDVQRASHLSNSNYFGLDVIWNLKVDFGPNKFFHCKVQWMSYGLDIYTCLNAQNLLLHWWGEDAVLKLSTMKGSDFRKADTLLRLLVLCKKLYPNRKFSELIKPELVNLAVIALFHVWDADDGNARRIKKIQLPLSKQFLEREVCIFRNWYECYQLGIVNDGPDYLISKTVVEKQIRQEFKPLNVCFDSWKKGGTYGSIPFVIAHLLLADALQILESESTKQMLVFFETVRKRNSISLMNNFWHHENIQRIFRVQKYSDCYYKFNTKAAKRNIKPGTYEFMIDFLEQLRLSNVDNTTPAFPWNGFKEFRKCYLRTQMAIYIIFLSIMGKRGPSEIATLRGIDITPSDELTGRNATMRPSIEKTNLGLREEQGVSNFIDQSFNTLLKMGYIDKSGTDFPLFTSMPSLSNTSPLPTSISPSQLSFNLQEYYIEFIERVKDRIDFKILESHCNLSSHQFRHSFAEFGLRRFDGNVEELLRQHFCHLQNHWWIKRYTEDKLDAKRIEQLNRSYIRELVPRILLDNPETPDFVGPMALFIKKNLAERIKVLSPEQVETYLEEFCSDFIQITPHEYGWCMLHKKYRSVAQCADACGTPKPNSTSSTQCNSCMNFCSSRTSHLEKQTQIALCHIDFLEQSIWKMPSLKEASINAVIDAQKLFPELIRLGSVK